MIRLRNSVFCSGLDLNVSSQNFGLLRRRAKDRHAPRQARVFATHDVFAAEHISPVCGVASRRSQGQGLLVSGSIFCHGVCATDLSRIAARYRSEPASPGPAAVPHGLSLSDHLAQYAGQCECHPTLANLCRFCPTPELPPKFSLPQVT